MFKANISNIPSSEHINDGLKLNEAFITTALKCVPPEDKPTKMSYIIVLIFLNKK